MRSAGGTGSCPPDECSDLESAIYSLHPVAEKSDREFHALFRLAIPGSVIRIRFFVFFFGQKQWSFS